MIDARSAVNKTTEISIVEVPDVDGSRWGAALALLIEAGRGVGDDEDQEEPA